MNPQTPHNPNPNSSNPLTDDRRNVNRSMPETSTAADVAIVDHIFSNLDSFKSGFHFIPTDKEVISLYNLQKTKNRSLLNIQMGDVDQLFSNHPQSMFEYQEEAEEGRWYLFSRNIRKVANGCWKPLGPSRVFSNDNGVNMCEKNCMVYYQGYPPTRTKTDWIMIEYTTVVRMNRLFGEIYPELDNYVICKIYKESDPDVILGLNSLGSSDEDETRPSSVGSNEDPNEQVQLVCDQLALLCNQERDPEQSVLPLQNPDAIVNQETNPRARTVQFQNNFALQNPSNNDSQIIVLIPVYPPPQAYTPFYTGRNWVWQPVYPPPHLPPVPVYRQPLLPPPVQDNHPGPHPVLPPVPVNPPRQTPIQYSTGGDLVFSGESYYDPSLDPYYNQSVPTYNPQGTQTTPPPVHVSDDGDNIEHSPSGFCDEGSEDSTAGSHEIKRKGG